MRVKIFTTHAADPDRQPAEDGMFADFVPGRDDAAGPSLAGRAGYGELAAQYHIWQARLDDYDYVGFERAGRPLLLAPMPTARLRLDFPDVAALLQGHAFDWRPAALMVPAPVLAAHQAMRDACGDGERAAMAGWLSRLDVVVTQPLIDADASGRRKALLAPRWRRFAEIAGATGVFRRLPGCMAAAEPHWPAFNTYVMRSALFREMIGATFDALFAFQAAEPALSGPDMRVFAERLVGIYLYVAAMRDPMLRVARAPVLVPEMGPARLPDGFDAASYLALNPDAAASGLSAEAHCLTEGQSPFRDWAM